MSRTTRLLLALGLNTALVVAQVVTGLVARSTSLLADAGHNLTDVIAIVLTLAAVRWSMRPRNDVRSYGNHRSTILAALVNAATLAVVTCAIVAFAIDRLIHPVGVTGAVVVAMGGAALAVNGLSAKVVSEPLHAHGNHAHEHGGAAARRDLNMRSVLVHMLGDAAASLAVVVAGIFVLVGGSGWDRADPAASLVVAALILWQAVKLLRESADVLLESTPPDIDLAALRQEVTGVAGVSEVHDLHVWSLSSDYRALSAHVVLSGHPSLEQAQALGAKVRHRLGERFDIAHATLEMECERCEDVPDDPWAADEIHGPRIEARTRRSPE